MSFGAKEDEILYSFSFSNPPATMHWLGKESLGIRCKSLLVVVGYLVLTLTLNELLFLSYHL